MVRKSIFIAVSALIASASIVNAVRISDRYDRVSLDAPDGWNYLDKSQDVLSILNVVSPDGNTMVTVNAGTAFKKISNALGVDFGSEDEQRARSINEFWADKIKSGGGEKFYDNPMGRDALGFWTMHTSWAGQGYAFHGFSSVRGEDVLEVIIGLPIESQGIPDEVSELLDSIRFESITSQKEEASLERAVSSGSESGVRYDRYLHQGVNYQIGTSDSVTVFLAMAQDPNHALVFVVNHSGKPVHFRPGALAVEVKKKNGQAKALQTFTGREWEQKQLKKAQLKSAIVAGLAAFQAGYNGSSPVQSYSTGSFTAKNTWDFTQQYEGTFTATTWRWPTPEEVASRNSAIQAQARSAMSSISRGLQTATSNLAYAQTIPSGQSYGGMIRLSKGKFETAETTFTVGGKRFAFAFEW